MDKQMLRRVVPMTYGILVVLVWLTMKGTVATVLTTIGAMLVGLFFVVTSPPKGEGRTRKRQ